MFSYENIYLKCLCLSLPICDHTYSRSHSDHSSNGVFLSSSLTFCFTYIEFIVHCFPDRLTTDPSSGCYIVVIILILESNIFKKYALEFECAYIYSSTTPSVYT